MCCFLPLFNLKITASAELFLTKALQWGNLPHQHQQQQKQIQIQKRNLNETRGGKTKQNKNDDTKISKPKPSLSTPRRRWRTLVRQNRTAMSCLPARTGPRERVEGNRGEERVRERCGGQNVGRGPRVVAGQHTPCYIPPHCEEGGWLAQRPLKPHFDQWQERAVGGGSGLSLSLAARWSHEDGRPGIYKPDPEMSARSQRG